MGIIKSTCKAMLGIIRAAKHYDNPSLPSFDPSGNARKLGHREIQIFNWKVSRKKKWTLEETRILVETHTKLGDQWDKISNLFERLDAEKCRIKWNNENLKK